MKHLIISLSLAAGLMALSTAESSAIVCARGVYHSGCVATGGAVAVGRPVARAAYIAPRRAVVRRRVY